MLKPHEQGLPSTAPQPGGPPQPSAPGLIERMRSTRGLAPLVAEAVATWRARADQDQTADESGPGWRAFSDAFPSFWEFTNRPR
jgi:hypothetical protein